LQEFLHLEYADKATLYVPVSQLQLISRYTGVSADEAPCTSWAAASGKKPSAKPPSRCATARPSCSTSTPAAPPARAMPSATRPNDYETFANDFGFEETADQKAAIHAVIQDMISPAPWTDWSAAMWVLAKPRWPCAPPLWP
jgi:transcription-repair coupling factor (superfamily II helicase)